MTTLLMDFHPIATYGPMFIFPHPQLFITYEFFIAIAITNYQSAMAFGSALVFGFIPNNERALVASAQSW